MRTTKVTVLPYDSAWKTAFEEIRKEIEEVVGDLIVGMEHVGSTSVEGMSAKPCIDLDVIIPDYTVFDNVVDRLKVIGYFHEGDLGIPGREAFRYSGKPHLQNHHPSPERETPCDNNKVFGSHPRSVPILCDTATHCL